MAAASTFCRKWRNDRLAKNMLLYSHVLLLLCRYESLPIILNLPKMMERLSAFVAILFIIVGNGKCFFAANAL